MPETRKTSCLTARSVFAADDIRVIMGANAGDGLGGGQSFSPGDICRLRAGAQPQALALRPKTGVGRGDGGGRDGTQALTIAEDSGIGRAGDALDVTARLTLMSSDGQLVELLILRHAPPPDAGAARYYALPLAPMAARTEYTLLSAAAEPGEMRPADVVCASFGAGARITMADGRQRPIERLAPGDLVLTRDHGAQPLRLNAGTTLRAMGNLAPVAIPAGAMGNAGALILSQRHRLFLYNRELARITGMPETLIEARQLVGIGDIHLRVGGYVDYRALIFDRHEIIYAEGIPAESLLVADTTIDTLPRDIAQEVRDRFPGLNQPQHFGVEIDPELLQTPGRRRNRIGR